MKESRIQLLKKTYEYEKNNNTPLSISTQNNDTTTNFQELETDIRFLIDNGYLTQPLKSIGVYHLSLTEKGETFVENGCTNVPSQGQSTFNINGGNFNNSFVGAGISGINMTFNSNPSLSELKELISSKPAIDQELLQELLAVLHSIDQSSQPVNKGFLSKFSDTIKKHTDLITPLGTALLNIFMRSV